MSKVAAEVVEFRIRINRLVRCKGRVRITRERGIVRRLVVLASKPRKRVTLLTRLAGNVVRTILVSVD